MQRPKGVSLIIGRPKGKTTTTTQAIRYDKTKWTADKAKIDCGDKGGTFEPAVKEAELPLEQYLEASWQDTITLEEVIMPGELEEAVFSYNDRRGILSAAIQKKFGNVNEKYGLWVRDMWEKELVYEDNNTQKNYRVSYSIGDKGTVELGEPKEVLVQTTYEEISEGVGEAEDLILDGDFLALIETIKGDVVPVKIIQPGWGSSGYYSSEVLARDAGVYIKGTKMFWDHPGLAEDKDRPERSLRDVAGVLASDGRWEANGSKGPGIYASAKVFDAFKGPLAELAPHIGVSHRALGKAKNGEAEGRKGPIIQEITAAQSVDFVTSPGAGGAVLQMFESAKGHVAPVVSGKEVIEMTPEEAKTLEGKVEILTKERDELKAANETLLNETTNLKAENLRLSEGALLAEAVNFVTAELKEKSLPDLTRQRLIDTLGKSPVIKEGKLDEEAFKALIKEKLDGEVEYLAKVTGSGAIRGMGTGGDPAVSLKETFESNYLQEGKSKEEAARLAEIAAEGR